MNSFGKIFRISVFGESHGESIGAVLDGVPAGIPLMEEDFGYDIDRRKGGRAGTTSRSEEDVPHIVSGVYRGYTTGAPVTICFNNRDTRPQDYCQFVDIPRPGHADFAASEKSMGFWDPRGAGHFSGRLTLPVVAAGVVAKKVLTEQVSVNASVVEMGGIPYSERDIWDKALAAAAKEGDSLGGIVECTVSGLPVGVGEPFWDSLESVISHAVFAIPGVRGIEFGDGFQASRMKGSEHNDPWGPDGVPVKNGAGGINGGLSNGAPVVFRVAFKPASGILKAQQTYNFKNQRMETLLVEGRYDTCFALRCPPVVEAMTAICLADLLTRL